MEQMELTTLMFENSADGILAFDSQYFCTLWNPAMEKLSGLQKDQIVGQSLLSRSSGVHNALEDKNYEDVLQGEEVRVPSTYLDAPDTDHCGYYETYMSPLHNQEGKVEGGMAVVRQVAEPLQAKRETDLQDQAFDGLLANTTDIVSRFDRQYRYLYINPVIESVTGLSQSDFTGKTNRELGMPGNLCDMWEREIEMVFRTGKTRRFEFSYPAIEADTIYDISFSPITDSEGNVSSVLGISRNLTELREAESQIRHIVQTIPGVIYTVRWKKNGKIEVEFVNQHLELLLGHKKEDIKSDFNKAYSLIHPDDRRKLMNSVMEVVAHNTPFKTDARVQTIDGNYLWLRVNVKTEQTKGGDVLYYGIALDVSHEKEIEQSLRESKEELQQRTEQLSERVKEMECLHHISTLISKGDLPLTKLFRQIARELPSGYQFPNDTEACINLYGRNYATTNFALNGTYQERPIYRYDRKVGKLQVALVEKNGQDKKDLAFLDEENHLIENVAGILGKVVERNKAERDLKTTNKKLKQLTNQLTKVREDEKQQISSVLHDEIGQELTAIKFDLHWLRSRITERLTDQNDMTEKIDRLIGLTETTVNTTRRIAHELRPVILDKMGLISAMEWQVQHFLESYGISCNIEADAPENGYHPDFAVILYRIFQEILTNIQRHADATRVDVTIRQTPTKLILTVRDNGNGLPDNGSASDQDKLGIFSIRQRVAYWHGQFNMTSNHIQGTEIRISVPLASVMQSKMDNKNEHAAL